MNEGGRCHEEASLLRVLVIEDEAMTGMLLARILVGLGHRVIGPEETEQGAVGAAPGGPARTNPGG